AVEPPAASTGGNKAGITEGALCTDVPVQRVQVDTLQPRLGEAVAEEGADRIGAVAVAPVRLLPDGDAQLRIAPALIDVVVHHIADVPAVQRLDREHAPERAGIADIVRV